MAKMVWSYAKWERELADAHAANARTQNPESEYTVKFDSKATTTGQNGVGSIGAWIVWEKAKAGNSPSSPASPTPPTGSGSGGGSRGGGGPQALAATMANQPQFTGGGQGFAIGATQIGLQLPTRSDEFRGIDTFTPDNKLDGTFAPQTINWDSFRRVGSRSPRAGIAKLADDRDTVVDGSAQAISSEYRGLSLCVIPCSGTQPDKLLLSFHDKDVEIGSAPGGSNSLTSHHLIDTAPRWGRPRKLTGLPGPVLALTDQTSQVLRVAVTYTNIFPNTQAELREASIKAITIRIRGPISGAGPYFPLDENGEDGTGSVYFNTGSDVNRRAWDGSGTSYDMDLSGAIYGAGKYWITAWAHGLEGTSEPSYGSLTIA